MVVRFIYGDDFWDSFDKANISLEELNSFRNFKSANPMAKFGNTDYKYKGGDLADTDCSHVHIRSDLILVYKLEGKNPHIIKLYLFTTHEESGTGTPAKPKLQKILAKKLKNTTFK